MCSQPFEPALEWGKDAEASVGGILEAAGWEVHPLDARAAFDFWVVTPWGPELIEVKREDRYPNTGRITIECLQGTGRRVPSGIATSEATVTVHTLAESATLYRTVWMRLWLKSRRLPILPFARADNGNQGWLVELRDLMDFGWFDHRWLDDLAESPVWDRMAICPRSAFGASTDG